MDLGHNLKFCWALFYQGDSPESVLMRCEMEAYSEAETTPHAICLAALKGLYGFLPTCGKGA